MGWLEEQELKYLKEQEAKQRREAERYLHDEKVKAKTELNRAVIAADFSVWRQQYMTTVEVLGKNIDPIWHILQLYIERLRRAAGPEKTITKNGKVLFTECHGYRIDEFYPIGELYKNHIFDRSNVDSPLHQPSLKGAGVKTIQEVRDYIDELVAVLPEEEQNVRIPLIVLKNKSYNHSCMYLSGKCAIISPQKEVNIDKPHYLIEYRFLDTRETSEWFDQNGKIHLGLRAFNIYVPRGFEEYVVQSRQSWNDHQKGISTKSPVLDDIGGYQLLSKERFTEIVHTKDRPGHIEYDIKSIRTYFDYLQKFYLRPDELTPEKLEYLPALIIQGLPDQLPHRSLDKAYPKETKPQPQETPKSTQGNSHKRTILFVGIAAFLGALLLWMIFKT